MITGTIGNGINQGEDKFATITYTYTSPSGLMLMQRHEVSNSWANPKTESYTIGGAVVTPTPTPVPVPSIGLELGVYNREAVPSVDDPLMKWNFFAGTAAMVAYPTSDKVVYDYWVDWSNTHSKWMDQSFLVAKFNQADQYKNEYEYAPFLLHEEMAGPIALSTWAEPRNTWTTSGTISFTTSTGIAVDAQLRDTWLANNAGKTEKDWEVYYTTTLYKAWNDHVHALGKKSMVIGVLPAGINNNLQADMEYQMPAWDYVFKNYDAIVDYSYPKSTAEVPNAVAKAQFLREKFNGQFIWILTSSFGDYAWSWSESVAQSEFNGVSPYVDTIVTYPYTNMATRTNPYPDYLIKFYNAR